MSEADIGKAIWILLWVLLVGVCAFALRRGGAAERMGATMILAVAVIALIIDALAPSNIQGVLHLVNDAALALGFLAIAIRYASLWLGAAMLFQSVQFSLHAYYFLGHRPADQFYSNVNNINTLGVLACVFAGTLITLRRVNARRRSTSSAASA
ncbi:MAG TPA: hypothetical protein VIO94_04305 [Phenylobacterium sp.]